MHCPPCDLPFVRKTLLALSSAAFEPAQRSRDANCRYFGTPGRLPQRSRGHFYTNMVPHSTFVTSFFLRYTLPALLYRWLSALVVRPAPLPAHCKTKQTASVCIIVLSVGGRAVRLSPCPLQPHHRTKSERVQRVVRKLGNLTAAFRHFTTNEYSFECSNVDRLIELMSPDDRSSFVSGHSRSAFFACHTCAHQNIEIWVWPRDFVFRVASRRGQVVEVENVEWEKYMYDFCWGLQYFILKENVPPWEMKNALSVPKYLGADLQFALEGGPKGLTPSFDKPPTTRSFVNAPSMQRVVAAQAEQRAVTPASLNNEVRKKFVQMRAKLSMSVIRLFAFVFPKIYRRLYDEILVDKTGLDKVSANTECTAS